MNKSFKDFPKDFLSIADFNLEQINQVLTLASKLKKERPKHKQVLKDKIIGVFTTKPSLRTRISFEIAILELGGKTLFIKDDEIGLGSRESYSDVSQVLSRYFNAFIIRSNDHKGLLELASISKISIINALTDEEHPCQILADLLTLQEIFGELKGLKLSYIGDANNVSNSLMLASVIIGIEFKIICPDEFKPQEKYIKKAKNLAKEYNSPQIQISNNPNECIDADVLYTDTWISMGQKVEKNHKEKFSKYQLNSDLLKNKNIPVLHCLPAHKGEEISIELFEKNSNNIFNQAENRLHAQKALLEILLGE